MSKDLRLSDSSFGESVEAALRRFFSPVTGEFDTSALRMRVDIAEKGDSYEVKADLPGVSKEDINVRIHGNVVQIDAEVKRDKETRGDGDKLLRTERYQGSVSRSFTLTQEVDEDKAQARYANGVLSLSLPKKPSDGSRKVTIE